MVATKKLIGRQSDPPFSPASTSNPNPTLLEFGIPETQKVCREAETNSLAFSIKWIPKTNIAPVNRPCQRETSIPTIHFQVRTVSFRQAIGWKMYQPHEPGLGKHIVTFLMLVMAPDFLARQEKTWSGKDSTRLIVQNNTSWHHFCSMQLVTTAEKTNISLKTSKNQCLEDVFPIK